MEKGNNVVYSLHATYLIVKLKLLLKGQVISYRTRTPPQPLVSSKNTSFITLGTLYITG